MLNRDLVRELVLIIKTQLSEYTHNPYLNIGFIVSLAIATSTLLSILILNHASKQQYSQADAKLDSPISYYIVPKQGTKVSVSAFAKLRQLGFHQLQPILSFSQKLKNGKRVSFKAMDLLSLSIISPNLYSVDKLLISNRYAENLQLNHVSKLVFANDEQLKFEVSSLQTLGHSVLLDISLAWKLFPEHTDFSYLIVHKMSDEKAKKLINALPDNLIIQQTLSLDERSGFADALHSNLTALALLGFLVSMFIAFQSAEQAWYRRSALMYQLRLLGVSLSRIYLALILEAKFLIIVSSLLGVLLALVLVSFLLPLLGFTLEQLYQLKTSRQLTWNWHYFYWSLLISSMAVYIALLKQFFIIGAQKVSLLAKEIKTNPANSAFVSKSLIFAIVCCSIFGLLPELDWQTIMIKYTFLLVATIAFLPCFLHFIFLCMSKITTQFKLRFILQDASNQIIRRYLPLAAFYLALTTSIAAALMINSFEEAFTKYLNQHLNEDLYIRFHQKQKASVSELLKNDNKVSEFQLYSTGFAQISKDKQHFDTVTVRTLSSQMQLSSLVFKAKINLPNASLLNQGCYINEQLAIKRDIELMDMMTVSQLSISFDCKVHGIFYDYGDPAFEIRILQKTADKHLIQLTELGFGVYLKNKENDNVQILKADLINLLNINDSQLYEPGEIKKLALNVFKKTFILTQAIAVVLLFIACFGLLLSANTLELARISDLHILVSLGYSQTDLFIHMLVQWLLLTAGCMLLSWPIAIVLANALVTKVLPLSFGWSMPLTIDISAFISSSLLGIVCLIPALYISLKKIKVGSS